MYMSSARSSHRDSMDAGQAVKKPLSDLILRSCSGTKEGRRVCARRAACVRGIAEPRPRPKRGQLLTSACHRRGFATHRGSASLSPLNPSKTPIIFTMLGASRSC